MVTELPERVRNARGWLAPEERVLLARLASETPPTGLIVNVGVEFGASLVCLRHGAPGRHIVGIDLDTSKLDAGLVADLAPLTLLQGDSGLEAETWAVAISLIFIDGDHSRRGVERDIAFLRSCNAGAVVVFHDCYDWVRRGEPHQLCPEVTAAVSAWAESTPYWEELEPVVTSRVFRRLPS